MKVLTFLVQAKQKSNVESTQQENALFSDLPGFLRDQFFPVLLPPKKANQSKSNSKTNNQACCFKVTVENNTFQLIHNDHKINVESRQILNLDNISVEILSEDEVVASEPEIQEINESVNQDVNYPKNIIYIPKVSNDYALMNDHFCAASVKNESLSILAPITKYKDKNIHNGDILRDLGFTDELIKYE